MDENLHEYLNAVVKNNELTIKMKDGSYNFKIPLKVTIYYTKLKNISLSSSANCSGSINEPSIKMKVSSGAEANLELTVEKLEINVSSGAEASLKGNAKSVFISGGAGGNINAKNLIAQTCGVNVGSGTNAIVTATQQLNANASSGASILYYGNPNIEKVNASSGGSIENGE